MPKRRQPPAMSAYPKIAAMVHQQRVNLGALKPGSVPLVECDKTGSIKARQAYFRSKPKVTIGGLRDRKYGVLRQPALSRPHVVNVLRDRLRRVQARR